MTSDHITGLKKVKRTWVLIKLEAARRERSSLSVITEMIRLYIKCGFGPSYYLLAGMADKGMAWEEKCRHLNDVSYHKALGILNPLEYRKITQHKLTEKAFFKLSNIPTSELIGFLQPSSGFDQKGSSLTCEQDLLCLLSDFIGQTIVIKLIEGHGGAGFAAGTIIYNEKLYFQPLNEPNKISISALISRYASAIESDGLLFERYLEQAITYSNFNSSSVNTVRTWALQTPQEIKVIGAYFRIGRKGSLIDNGDGGGIMCPVDPTTGILGKGVTTKTPYRDEMEKHLDHDIQLNGVQLPSWQEVLDCSCETLRKLPHTRFAGMDVAMTETGASIIEVNVAPDKDGAAYGFIQSRLLLEAAVSLRR